MKLKDIAKHIPGEIVGNGDIPIKGVASLEEAQKGRLVFVLDEKLLKQALNSKAAAVIAPSTSKIKEKPALLVKNPRMAMVWTLRCIDFPP